MILEEIDDDFDPNKKAWIRDENGNDVLVDFWEYLEISKKRKIQSEEYLEEMKNKVTEVIKRRNDNV